MRTIAIVLGDNDFYYTMKPLLESVARAIEWHSKPLPKEEIITIINAGIEFHYLAFQMAGKHNSTGYGTVESSVKYLTERIKILFDEEAEKDIETRFNNSEAWYLEIQTGEVYSY